MIDVLTMTVQMFYHKHIYQVLMSYVPHKSRRNVTNIGRSQSRITSLLKFNEWEFTLSEIKCIYHEDYW